MKNLLFISILLIFSNTANAQTPCLIKYTYDDSGNRIKREFVCGQADTIIYTPGCTSCPRLAAPSTTQNNNTSATLFDVLIAPNPGTGIFKINVLSESKLFILFITNSNGQSIVQTNFQTNFYNVDLSNYPMGIYYFTVSDGVHKLVQKVVKTGD
jgi:Secretion system C-terminal sorting domain